MSTAAPLQNTAAKSQVMSESSTAGLLLQRKCVCGSTKSALIGECEECKNQELKNRTRLQPKLSIGASNNPLEQEADRVADQVLAVPAYPAVSSAVPSIQRFSGQATADAGIAPASVERVLASSGRPLDPALQQDMGQRFGHDFSQVRVHTGVAAEQSAQEVHAHAYTVGHNMVFGAGRYEPGSQVGRRLIAHELTHVVQQLGADEMNVGQSNDKRSLSPVAPMMHPSDSVAPTGVAASVLGLQRSAGNRIARAPLNGSSGGGLLQREPDDPLEQGLDEARQVLREADEVAKDLLEEVNGERMKGRVRDNKVTRRLKQKLRDLATRSPPSVMDPEAEKAARLLGQIEDLERELHERRIARERVIGAPKTDERRKKQARAAAETEEKAAKKVENAAGKSGEAAPKSEKFAAKSPTRSTGGADLAQNTRIRGTSTEIGEGVSPPSGDVAEEKAAKKVEQAAGKSEEAAPKAEKFEAKFPTRSTGGADMAQNTRIRATATSPGGGPRSPATSRDVAAEMANTATSIKNMATAVKIAHWALQSINFIGLLERIATARNIAASTLANVTPYHKEIRQAIDIAADAKNIADYYNSLDLRENIPDTGWGAFDEGSSILMGIQMDYYLTESHLHDALESVLAAKKDIAEQITGVGDKLREKKSALILMIESTPLADLHFYSEAAFQILKNLSEAADSYEDARKSIYLQERMAQASIKFIEMRLRELDASGFVTIDIAAADLKGASLDNFTMRR
ncbi:MAG TPA: DUF4157 domain-containing protein [Anaerolineales bacterium]|nr:DUF4157 domain-containing protein [Anaerolineales bacterium]